jgi:hypothetical protein
MSAWVTGETGFISKRLGVAFTNVNTPLARPEMIAPTKFYEHVPILDPDEAADLVVEALIHRPARVATPLGRFGQAPATTGERREAQGAWRAESGRSELRPFPEGWERP